jgi:hypothetical protein
VLCAVTIPPAGLRSLNNGTKHGGGPPEDGREKRPKHVGVYTYKHVFNILFFTTIFRGSPAVLCAVTIHPADLRSLSLYYYAVCGRMCMSSVCVC